MTKGISGKEPDPRVIYADIIDLPHHQSPTRPHMSLYDRAAQFAPFAALTGYDDMVTEEARIVDNKIELSETEIDRLNQKLSLIADVIEKGEKPKVTVTYFVPDQLKAGGRYETLTDRVRKVDALFGKLILEQKEGTAGSHKEIRIADILEIESNLFYS